MDEKIAEKRLVSFNKECILAGPRQSVVSFLKMLMNLGADVTKATSAKSLITSKSNIVLLLKNEGKSKKFPQITGLGGIITTIPKSIEVLIKHTIFQNNGIKYIMRY